MRRSSTGCSASRSSAPITRKASATSWPTRCCSRPTTRCRARPLVRRNPVQEFVWGDYTAEPDHAYTYRVAAMGGTPEKLGPASAAEVHGPDENPDDGKHGVFFNRGVAASQAYSRASAPAPGRRCERAAYRWLSRGLEEALLAFIGQALGRALRARAASTSSSTARCSRPSTRRAAAGADVEDRHPRVREEGRRHRRAQPCRDRGRRARRSSSPRTQTKIAHNKFIVLLATASRWPSGPARPTSPTAAIFGHANVGHAIRDPARRAAPISTTGTRSPATRAARALRALNDSGRVPRRAAAADAARRSSARAPASTPLDWYCRLAEPRKERGVPHRRLRPQRRAPPVFNKRRRYLRYLLLDLATGNVEALRRDPATSSRPAG